MTAIEVAKARLAETETLIADGLGGPYAKQNLAAHKARVARLSAEAPAPVFSSSPAPPLPVPTRAQAKPPQPQGTREERLTRLAAAFDADEATLEAAIADGTSPDEFALICSEESKVKAKVREIIAA